MNNHPVITADYPSNQTGGIMICGINFGYSVADEELERQEIQNKETPSYFSDTSVNNTKFRNRILKWLESWGLDLSSIDAQRLKESFFQTNWLDSQTNSTTSNGKIGVKDLINNADGFLTLLENRSPVLVIFFGSDLIEALNDIKLRDRVENAIGKRHGNACQLLAVPTIEGENRFHIRAQEFGRTTILSIPHPQTRGLTDEYISRFKSPINSIFKKLSLLENH